MSRPFVKKLITAVFILTVITACGYYYKQALKNIFQRVYLEASWLNKNYEPERSLKELLPEDLSLPYVLHQSDIVKTELIQYGLNRPWSLEVIPKKGLLITEVPGQIRYYDWTTQKLSYISGVPFLINSHRAHLFDIAIHPNFSENQQVYLSYAVDNGKGFHSVEVAMAQLDIDKLELHNWHAIFQSTPPVKSRKHFGGGLVVKDGFVYLSIGDRDDRSLVQDSSTSIGKVMRIPEQGGSGEIYATGFRNPQKMTLDNVGKLWLVDHGPKAGDELNQVIEHKNYGWPDYTSGTEYNGKQIAPSRVIKNHIKPRFTKDNSFAPSGLAFYTGSEFPSWQDNALISTLVATHLKQLVLTEKATVEHKHMLDLKLRLRDVEVDPSTGIIYILSEGGSLMRLSRSTLNL